MMRQNFKTDMREPKGRLGYRWLSLKIDTNNYNRYHMSYII